MKRSYYNNTSFLDLLFNFLLATLILLVIAVLNIVEEKNQADIKTEAEFVLTLEWNKNQDNDIDVWVEDPNGDMLWYRSQDTGIIHLDRDDRGKLDDHYENGKAIQINQEIVTFRGILPGEWCINEHFFRMGENKEDHEPVHIKTTFIKINPRAKIIFQKEITLTERWEQVTVARFTMSEKGEILSLEDGPFKDLIKDNVDYARYGSTVRDVHEPQTSTPGYGY